MIALKRQLAQTIETACKRLWPNHSFGRMVVEETKEQRFGEFASNVAMQLAGQLKASPMVIGEQIAHAAVWPASVRKVFTIAPGFLNIFLDPAWLSRQPALLAADRQFGASTLGKGRRVNLEFISANPTGPLHVGNGRGGFTGDVLGNVLKLAGFRVHREYYINDRGKQVAILAESVTRQYFISQGIKVEFPEYCYRGAYVKELVKKLNLTQYKLMNVDQLKRRLRARVLTAMLRDIRTTVEKRMVIRFNRWFSEEAMVDRGLPKKVLALLRERGLISELEGAVWMKTSQFGDEKDRVLVRSGGEETYFLSDVAYLYDKFLLRKFDRAIIILGADHHGYVNRLRAVLKAFALDPGRLTVIVVQLVRLIREGQEVRMSKRAGTFATIDELIDEVGLDAARFFFLMHDAGTHMDFDLALAKKRSDDNPVYYVQYAHARIRSILRNTKKLGPGAMKPYRLAAQEELDLTKLLVRFPDVVEDTAGDLAPQRLTQYARDLATAFHSFYTTHRIIDNGVVLRGRLDLAKATQVVLARTLHLMGIRAPEKM